MGHMSKSNVPGSCSVPVHIGKLNYFIGNNLLFYYFNESTLYLGYFFFTLLPVEVYCAEPKVRKRIKKGQKKGLKKGKWL